MSGNVLAFTIPVAFVEMQCGECGVTFAMTQTFRSERMSDHQTWYCPNGHARHWAGESEAEKLRKALELKERALNYAREREESLRASNDTLRHQLHGTKGALTKVKKRIQNGCCPSCNRTFADLARHMQSKHPESGKKE
jgi:protein-arginine kinase activator protein McsA